MLPTTSKYKWGLLVGLMAGIVQAHAVQPIASLVGELPWRNKFYISIAGAVLYSITLIGLAFEKKWALWITVFGPIVGVTAIIFGTAATTTIRPDTFQVVGGSLQLVALIVACKLLKEGNDGER